MRKLILVAALGLGCAQAPIKIEFSQAPNMLGPGTHPVVSSVYISPRFYARGCADLRIKDGNDVRLTIQQDGTSDYAGIRVAPLLVKDAIAAAMTVIEAPTKLVASLLGVRQDPPPGPSEIHGCGGVRED